MNHELIVPRSPDSHEPVILTDAVDPDVLAARDDSAEFVEIVESHLDRHGRTLVVPALAAREAPWVERRFYSRSSSTDC